jgi:heat shock protein HslJ
VARHQRCAHGGLPALILALAAAAAAAAAEPPAGDWRLVALNGAAPQDGTAVTLTVGPDGALSGSAGCNRYRAEPGIGPGADAIGPIAVTRMLCPEPRMAQERAYLEALERVTRWRLAMGGLRLDSGDGAVSLLFEPEPEP